MPNGSACAIDLFVGIGRVDVLNKFMARVDLLLGNMAHRRQAAPRTRAVAWGPVRCNFTPDPLPPGLDAREVAQETLNTWMDSHVTASQEVILPLVCVRMASGKVTRAVLHPQPDLECVTSAGAEVVAIRTQLPLVPAAVRTAGSVLSVTVRPRTQRVVVHVRRAPDVTLDADAHNAALFIALTRVMNAADVALSHDTELHANVFTPRQALTRLLPDLRQLGAAKEHCKVYHCRAHPKTADEDPSLRPGAHHDDRLREQLASGFFMRAPGVAEALVASLPPELDLGV